jgi:hypothetical protein
MPAVNYEQLEAEFVRGSHLGRFCVFNITQLAYLVFACQHALRADDINSHAAAVLRDIAQDLERTPFGQETRKLIAAGWRTP